MISFPIWSLQVFLTHYNKMERAVYSGTSKPGWVTSYNFASLLNVPRALKNFGPLIDLWEGKNQGEGIVKCIKHALMMGLRKGWQKNILEKLLVRKAMGAVMMGFEGRNHGAYFPDNDNEADEDNRNIGMNPHNNEPPDQSLHYHRYDTVFEVYTAIQTRQPLSCVLLEEEGHTGNVSTYMGAVMGNDQCVELDFGGYHYREVNGMVYKQLLYEEFNDPGFFLPQQIVASLLLLPILVEIDNPYDAVYYTAVNSRWEL